MGCQHFGRILLRRGSTGRSSVYYRQGSVQSDQKKYNYVVASIPQEVAESFIDVSENPPEDNQYINHKETLIKRHSISLENRITKLGDEFVKKLWRLPNLINIIPQSDEVIDTLLYTLNKI